jgi:hypothetical protein
MARLEATFGSSSDTREVIDARSTAYREALADLSDEQWRECVTKALKTLRFMPKPAELLELATGGAQKIQSEAGRAFECVIEARTYHPEGGASWTYRGVEEKCGRACAEAFVAAGGAKAFAVMSERDRPFVFKAFCEAYVAAVRADADSRLRLPASTLPQLPEGPRPPITVVWEPAPPEPKIVRPSKPGRVRGVDVVVDVDEKADRLEELRRQAAEIGG